MTGGVMRRRVFGPAVSALLAIAVTACGREAAKSEIELTTPAQTTAEMEDSFGKAVADTSRADPSSVPKDPSAEDMGPVSYTAEPIPIPAE